MKISNTELTELLKYLKPIEIGPSKWYSDFSSSEVHRQIIERVIGPYELYTEAVIVTSVVPAVSQSHYEDTNDPNKVTSVIEFEFTSLSFGATSDSIITESQALTIEKHLEHLINII